MLISFKVANFQAFRDPQELSMRRARGLKSPAVEGWDPSVTSLAAIYGANASGKSTFYRSIRYFVSTVRDSFRRWEIDEPTGVVPFVLDDESVMSPTEFEMELRTAGNQDYQYGFAIDHDGIVGEWLYSYNGAYRSLLFERDRDAEAVLRFGKSFKGNRTALIEAASGRKNALTLSAGTQLGNALLQPVFREITSGIRTYDARAYESGLKSAMRRVDEDDAFARRLIDVLGRADLGVCDVAVQSEPVDEEYVANAVKVAEALGQDIDEEAIRRFTEERGRKLQLSHSRRSGEPLAFPVEWESAGTQALVAFATSAFDVLSRGATMVVDEIDSSLHPLLVAELVAVFRDPQTNPQQAQLIFTTHDVSLLERAAADGSARLLDRDQIWVTEKASDGASSLVAVSEYRTPRKEENLARGYMTGRYGGVPVLSVFSALLQENASAN